LAKFIKGDIVVVPFPFSDLTQAKRRPAMVIADLDGDDVILCQITSQSVADRYSIVIAEADFASGSLKQQSNARPNRIFTADSHIILYKVGKLNPGKIGEIIDKVVSIVSS